MWEAAKYVWHIFQVVAGLTFLPECQVESVDELVAKLKEAGVLS